MRGRFERPWNSFHRRQGRPYSGAYAFSMAKIVFFGVFVDIKVATLHSKPRLQYIHVRVGVQ